MYFWAALPIGTNRSLLPLPVILIKPSSKYKSEIFNDINSETRSPQPYSVSSMARLRSPSFEVKSIAAMRESISSTDSISGSFLPVLGVSTSSKGLSER